MIELELTKAEALLAYELFKQNNEDLLEQISQGLDEQMTHENMQREAQKNRMLNLENKANEVEELLVEIHQLRAQLDAHNLASKSNKIKTPAKRLKPVAPWGYKKDGTPKKRPGRAVGV
jgi:hypothetical protein